MRKSNSKGTVLMYSLLLVNFAVLIWYIVFLKSQTLLENARYTEISTKLSKNIEERGKASMDYGLFLNRNGSGFTNTTSCPTVTFTGTRSWSTYSESIPTVVGFDGKQAHCSGTSIVYPWERVILKYAPGFLSFSGITYRNIYGNLSGNSTLTGILADSEASAVSLVIGNISGIDANFNSDDYRNSSTGTIQYPNGSKDDDDLARIISYGYVRKDKIWRNIFWNTPGMAQRIRKNTNNTGALAALPDATATGMLYLDLDSSYQLKIVEFDANTYANTKELRIKNTVRTSSATGAIGHLQADLSVASWSTNTRVFDLKNKSYGIFLMGSGTTWDFLRYKYYFKNQSGSMVYTVPIDDSDPYQMVYYGGDIILNSDNLYIGKEQEIIQPK